MKVRLEIELDYDAEIMHGNTADGISWFNSILFDPGEDLILHSNELGDEIGTVKILRELK